MNATKVKKKAPKKLCTISWFCVIFSSTAPNQLCSHHRTIPWKTNCSLLHMLVGGIPTPLKNISQWNGLSHIFWKNKKCSKPLVLSQPHPCQLSTYQSSKIPIGTISESIERNTSELTLFLSILYQLFLKCPSESEHPLYGCLQQSAEKQCIKLPEWQWNHSLELAMLWRPKWLGQLMHKKRMLLLNIIKLSVSGGS